jgi:hypothetical protein
MTATRQTHPLRAQATRERLRAGAVHRNRRSRRRTIVARAPIATPAMGAANTPAGVPTMGAPTRSLHPAMGQPDAGLLVSVMGAGDQGPGIELFGAGDPGLVDWLFASQGASD